MIVLYKNGYQELRTRLPSTISDQVVQLIANSKQALLDFAEIRTQQDVDQFNQLYDNFDSASGGLKWPNHFLKNQQNEKKLLER